MAPSTFTRLSIVCKALFKIWFCFYALRDMSALRDQSIKLTFIQGVEHWYGVITGNPISKDAPPVYKYFKRDVLKPAYRRGKCTHGIFQLS